MGATVGYWIRKRLPGWARRLLRLSRLALVPGQSSAQAPPELFADCRMCASRYDLLNRLPRGGRVAEIGTFKGHFAHYILERCAPDELHLVDLDCSQLAEGVAGDPRVRLHTGQSHHVLARFPDGYFDWIYIDADHSFEGVSRDAKAAAPKVKPSGYLVFNDFAHNDPFLGSYGVHRAVMAFAVSERWPLRWMAYESNALYDVALQRPATGSEKP